MGYKIPNTEEQINEALNKMTKLNQLGLIDSMRTLMNAYEDCEDPVEFGQHHKNWFHELYTVQNQLGLTNGKSENELFPTNMQTYDNFSDSFRQLWNSISMYHELKLSNPELAEETSIADLHQNYSENYTQILIEKDMFDSLKKIGRFEFYDDSDKYRTALKNLNLYQVAHKIDEPFSDSELEDIQKQTKALNQPFNPRGSASEGLFAGIDIKTPADLQNYIDRYETMLRDFMQMGGNNMYLYAQRYEPAEDAVKKLSKHDLSLAEQELQHLEVRKSAQQIYDDFGKLENEKQFNATLNEETTTAISAFDKLDESSRQQLGNDQELKEAQAAYDQELARCRKLAEQYSDIRKAASKAARSEGNNRKTRETEEMKKKVDDYKYAIQVDPDFSNSFTKDRLREAAVLKQAASDYTRNMKSNMKDVRNFRQEIQDTLGDFSARQRKLNENPQPLEYEQRLLDKDSEDFTKKIESKVQKLQNFRENEKNKLSNATSEALINLKNSYADEKADRLKALKDATDKLQSARKEMADYYKNTDIAKRNTEKLKADLKEAFNAMTSVKKFSFLGIGGSDSSEYTTMVNAVNDYLEGKLSAEDAHKACEGYLTKHMDNHGKLKDMASDLGRLRKQGCVRMMELLSQDPGYIADKIGNETVATENEVSTEKKTENQKTEGSTKKPSNAQHIKIDYATLKEELSKKSAEIDEKNNKKDAKAFSNLNQKIKEQKKKAKSEQNKKTSKKNAAPKKDSVQPSKGK